jgi:hypothetical protein
MVILLVGTQAKAQQPLSLYDDFSGKFLDPDRWASNQSCGNVGLECVREIRSGSLRLVDRSHGVTTADSGGRGDGSFINFADPQDITAIQALVRIANVEVSACAANPAVSHTQALIFGTFFNTGTPTPGSFVNDVVASFNIQRRSDTTDSKNTLHIEGVVMVCSAADCSAQSSTTRLNFGTLGKGQAITLLIDYDTATDTFLFRRQPGGEIPLQTVSGLCSAAPCAPAGNALKFMGVDNFVASCSSTPRPVAYMEALFDDIMVNASALPLSQREAAPVA